MIELTEWSKKKFRDVLPYINHHPEFVPVLVKWDKDYRDFVTVITDPDHTKSAKKKAEQKLAQVTKSLEGMHRKIILADLLRHAGGVCYLCGKPIVGEYNMDHVLPVSTSRKQDGKAITGGNVMPTHVDCNHRRGNTALTDEQLAFARETYRKADRRFYDQDPKEFYMRKFGPHNSE